MKREGDGATPAGAHRILGLRYRADRIARPRCPAFAPRAVRATGPRDGWSDDPADPRYNRPVRRPHRFGHERMARADPLYDLVLLTDWNTDPAVRGRGSAIFVHLWRSAPARRPRAAWPSRAADLVWILARLGPRARLVVRGRGPARGGPAGD